MNYNNSDIKIGDLVVVYKGNQTKWLNEDSNEYKAIRIFRELNDNDNEDERF